MVSDRQSDCTIHHLETPGYGPQGILTRAQWRAECLTHFMSGKDAFILWQKNVESQSSPSPPLSFDFECTAPEGGPSVRIDLQLPRSTIDLSGIHFKEELDLFGFYFGQPVLFDGSIFDRSVDFAQATFAAQASYRMTRFRDGVIAERARFQKETYFDEAEFRQPALFESSHFEAVASFVKAKSSGEAHFHGAIFAGTAGFTGAVFGKSLDMSRAQFCGIAEFQDVITFDTASFFGARFAKGALFDRAHFESTADFRSDAQESEGFRDFVSFRESIFKGEALFSKQVFAKRADFDKVCFLDEAHFADARFLGPCDFEEARFERFANFEDAEFVYQGHFEDAIFASLAPSFRGCQIDSTRLEFSATKSFPAVDASDAGIRNISFLKRLADEHGQVDQALAFNALELRAKRAAPQATPFFRLVTWLYEVLSDYGREFSRPLIAYFCLIALTGFLALGHAAYSLEPKDCSGITWKLLSDLERSDEPCRKSDSSSNTLYLSGYRAAAEYTLYRAGGILDFSDSGKSTDAVSRRLFGQTIEPWWMRLWGIFKAISSTALLFLVALGLRNKYRIK